VFRSAVVPWGRGATARAGGSKRRADTCDRGNRRRRPGLRAVLELDQIPRRKPRGRHSRRSEFAVAGFRRTSSWPSG
jgi:hypothetical protein